MTALILAQVAVTPGALPVAPEQAEQTRNGLIVVLRAFAAAATTPYAAHLADAELLRRRDRHPQPGELAYLADAVILARNISPAS
ncbi:hypothetical protein CC117_22910 [Parafrankia colletiae]|uniref:Uncharacterized protein n=1 Tax=Parafrankia colletiae TaxID=573497 RepID=A0A1S1QFD7_9ACTN|nr:hypothetical protein [Parafrankia colletiae]MCK9901441.1 hypothetical protein [Frankia sp. Cpl3]OHV33513.1 hypothetical protein CC117_22910 [Parafrankia colletiae]